MNRPSPISSGPGPAPARITEHASEQGRIARQDLLRLLALFAPYWRWMAAGALLSFMTLSANIGLMAVSGWFIASMALAGLSGTPMDYFTPAALIRGMAIARTLGRYLERIVTHEATFRLLAQLRVWFYTRIEPLAPARLHTVHSADLLSRIQADIDAVNHVYLRVFVPAAAGAAGVLLSVAVMACYSVPVALVALVCLLAAGALLPAWLYRQGWRPGARIVAARAALRTAVIDGLQGCGELRVYGALEAHQQRVDALSLELCAAQRRISTLSGIGQGTLILCSTAAVWATLWLAAPQVRSGALAGPDLAMLTLFVMASFEAVAPLPVALQMLGETLAAARRIFALADLTPLVHEPEHATPLRAQGQTPAQLDVQLRNVSLRYAPHGPFALHDVSLHLRAGERMAVVGASGAGKSSLVNVLLRFWDYSAGSITLGGAQLRECAAEDVRACIAVVSQDTYLFNATIRENLLIARPHATQAQLEAACRDAQLHEFITGLPQSYDTELGEAGARLSGGQARRLAIARALLLDAPLLILDEPTEGLDALTERDLLEAIMRLMAGRSVLLITHKLSALSDAVDRIVVLEQGRVVQQGPADIVRAAAGQPYRRLAAALG